MGVKNTRYERVTVYLKKAQVDFLKKVIHETSDQNVNKLSRSDVIRAILDCYCDTKDWQTEGLLRFVEEKTNYVYKQNNQ